MSKLSGIWPRTKLRKLYEPPTHDPNPPERLRFKDSKLVDPFDRARTLRGVSLFWSQWKPAFFNAGLVRWLVEDWRVDVIRVPIAAMTPGFLDQPGEELAKACTVIDACICSGIYVMLDWHGHHPHTEQCVRFFGAIAQRYGNSPHVIYETWNEPAARYDWHTDIVPHHETVISTIRDHAPDAVIVAGTPGYCTDLGGPLQAPLAQANIGYSLHFYAATHRQGLRSHVEAALAKGLPIFASEWGLSEADGAGVLDFDEGLRWLNFLNSREISHINWSICDKDEAAAALRRGAAPEGRWSRRDLSASGKWVRAYLLDRAPHTARVVGSALAATTC